MSVETSEGAAALNVESRCEDGVCEARKRPSKTVKKKLKYEKKLEMYRQKKLEKKQKKKEARMQNLEDAAEDRVADEENCDVQEEDTPEQVKKKHKPKRLFKAIINERLRKVHEDNECEQNVKVCIDLSFSSLMTEKEQSRLGQQIGRCYASNRAASVPAQITLSGIDTESFFYKEMRRVNDGFDKFIMIKQEKSIEELYTNDLAKLCYLSPDAENTLDTVDLNKIYVIGGLVDETVTKKATLTKSQTLKLNCFRLPIEEHMDRRSNKNSERQYNFNKILALNQVLDILLNYNVTKDWKNALASGVPSRKGFFIEKEKSDL